MSTQKIKRDSTNTTRKVIPRTPEAPKPVDQRPINPVFYQRRVDKKEDVKAISTGQEGLPIKNIRKSDPGIHVNSIVPTVGLAPSSIISEVIGTPSPKYNQLIELHKRNFEDNIFRMFEMEKKDSTLDKGYFSNLKLYEKELEKLKKSGKNDSTLLKTFKYKRDVAKDALDSSTRYIAYRRYAVAELYALEYLKKHPNETRIPDSKEIKKDDKQLLSDMQKRLREKYDSRQLQQDFDELKIIDSSSTNNVVRDNYDKSTDEVIDGTIIDNSSAVSDSDYVSNPPTPLDTPPISRKNSFVSDEFTTDGEGNKEVRVEDEAEKQRKLEEVKRLKLEQDKAARDLEIENKNTQEKASILLQKKLAEQNAKKQRLAEEEVEKQRLAEAERQRLAAEEAEKQRVAAEEEAERQRLAEQEAEKQRLATEEAERQRLAEAERQRVAEEAERQRLAAEYKAKADKYRFDEKEKEKYRNIASKTVVDNAIVQATQNAINQKRYYKTIFIIQHEELVMVDKPIEVAFPNELNDLANEVKNKTNYQLEYSNQTHCMIIEVIKTINRELLQYGSDSIFNKLYFFNQ